MNKNYIYEGQLYKSNEALLNALEKDSKIIPEPGILFEYLKPNKDGLIEVHKETFLIMLSTVYLFTSKQVTCIILEEFSGLTIEDCEKFIDSNEFQSFFNSRRCSKISLEEI